MKAAATVRAAMASDTGLQRSSNEDRVYLNEARGIFMVIDGVGGHAAGDKAADLALELIPHYLDLGSGSVEEKIRWAITSTNNDIFDCAQGNEDWRGMACVLTLAVANDEMITV